MIFLWFGQMAGFALMIFLWFGQMAGFSTYDLFNEILMFLIWF